MEMIREIAKYINEKQYTNIKMKIMNESSQYIRDCSFLREIVFEYMNSEYDVLGIQNQNNMEDLMDKERLEFSIQFNRYNTQEIYLHLKANNHFIVNEIKTILTKEEVNHILNKDYNQMLDSDNIIITQLAMQMKYNYCYPMVIREFFLEKYYNIYRGDMLRFESMEIYLENDVKEFFSDKLTPLEEIDYNNIKMYHSKKIMLPTAGFAGSIT